MADETTRLFDADDVPYIRSFRREHGRLYQDLRKLARKAAGDPATQAMLTPDGARHNAAPGARVRR